MKLLFTLAVLPLAFVAAIPESQPTRRSAFAHPLGRPAHLSNTNSHAEFNGEEIDFFNHPGFGAPDDSDFHEHSDNNNEYEMDLGFYEGGFEEEYLRHPHHTPHHNGDLAKVFNGKMRHYDNSDDFRPESDDHHNLDGRFEEEEEQQVEDEVEEEETAQLVKSDHANDGAGGCSHDGERMQHDRREGYFRHGRN